MVVDKAYKGQAGQELEILFSKQNIPVTKMSLHTKLTHHGLMLQPLPAYQYEQLKATAISRSSKHSLSQYQQDGLTRHHIELLAEHFVDRHMQSGSIHQKLNNYTHASSCRKAVADALRQAVIFSTHKLGFPS